LGPSEAPVVPEFDHDVALAIRNEPVILRRHLLWTLRVYASASRTPPNIAIVAMIADLELRANLAQKRPVPSLEELNDGDKIEVVRREIASQVDRSVQRHGGAKQEQGGCGQQEEREAGRENHDPQTKERTEGRCALQQHEKVRGQTTCESDSEETVSRNTHQARRQHGAATGCDRGKAERRGSRTIGRGREGSRHDLSRVQARCFERDGSRRPASLSGGLWAFGELAQLRTRYPSVRWMRSQPIRDGGEDRIATVVDGDDVAVSFGPPQRPLGRRKQSKRPLGCVRRNAMIVTGLHDERWDGHLRRRRACPHHDSRELEDQTRCREAVCEIASNFRGIANRTPTAAGKIRKRHAKHVMKPGGAT
jgi:hypothetical protein